MAKVLTRLKIREVSSVDRGAGEGVNILLMKRHEESFEDYCKRTFSTGERRADAKSGAALPDGSFPIENGSDLKNAMRAIGRAKDPAKAKAHIRARARALGLTSELSDAFKREPLGFFSKFFRREEPSEVIDKALNGLSESVASILKDEGLDADGAAAALDKSFEQFGDHLKETLAAGGAVEKKEGESDMDLAILRKALGLADTATEADVTKALGDQAAAVAKMKLDLAIAKANFSPEELSFYKDMADGDGDDGEDGRDGDDDARDGKKTKKSFRLASKTKRAEIMKAAAPALPAEIIKALADAESLRKRVAELEGRDELTALNKRAAEHDLPEAEGATLQKAYRGDKEAVDKLLGFIKQANAAAKSAGVFKEFGSTRSDTTNATAYEQLKAKADDLKKSDPSLTIEKAFAKVYEDPANADLVKRERSESRPSAA